MKKNQNVKKINKKLLSQNFAIGLENFFWTVKWNILISHIQQNFFNYNKFAIQLFACYLHKNFLMIPAQKLIAQFFNFCLLFISFSYKFFFVTNKKLWIKINH